MEELTFNENVGKHISDFSRDVSERCQGPFFVISRDIKPRPGRRRLECPHRALLLHQITERPQFQGCRSANENKRSPVWRLQIILCHRFFGIFKAKKRKPLIPLKQYKNRNWKEIKFKIFNFKKNRFDFKILGTGSWIKSGVSKNFPQRHCERIYRNEGLLAIATVMLMKKKHFRAQNIICP